MSSRAERILITGSTSGLGRAMAGALIQTGAQVAITGRDRSRAEGVAHELGPQAIAVGLDVRHDSSVLAGVDEVYERFGGVDMLVLNAGIGMRTINPRFLAEPQPFWMVPHQGFRDVMETKVTGTFLVARAVVPRMLRGGGGRVVTISMNEGTMTRRGFVPYGPSGAAVEALSRVMAADLVGTPIRVNILLPGGATATGMVPEDTPAHVRAGLLDPAIMGPPIAWLASADAADVHDERIVATHFADWLRRRAAPR
jgi:gluconate 5-dehydrogenase